jgi:antirestriction protein ArdC
MPKIRQIFQLLGTLQPNSAIIHICTKQGNSNGKGKKEKIDRLQWLTDKFIELLQEGVNPWEREWRTSGPNAIRNFVTGKPYSGSNIWVLGIDALCRGGDPLYCGRKQGFEKGWKIRKGSKAAFVLFASPITKETADGETETFFMAKWSPVFHIDSWDDSDSEHKIQDLIGGGDTEPLNPDERLEAAERFISNTGAEIITQGSEPCYSPIKDRIAMPAWEDFTSAQAFYATQLHELGHWSGHSSRCNRPMEGRFGTPSYAREELVAEMTSAALCLELGIPSKMENHASYLDSWLKAAREDKEFLYKTIQQARVATEFLRSLQEKPQTIEAA